MLSPSYAGGSISSALFKNSHCISQGLRRDAAVTHSSPLKKEILRFAQNDNAFRFVMLSVSEASRRSRVVRKGLFQRADSG